MQAAPFWSSSSFSSDIPFPEAAQKNARRGVRAQTCRSRYKASLPNSNWATPDANKVTEAALIISKGTVGSPPVCLGGRLLRRRLFKPSFDIGGLAAELCGEVRITNAMGQSQQRHGLPHKVFFPDHRVTLLSQANGMTRNNQQSFQATV